MIKKYGFFIFILFVFSIAGCHTRETVSFNINKNANDSLPLKVSVDTITELNDSVNVHVYILKDIIIKNTYSYPIYLAYIFSVDTVDNGSGVPKTHFSSSSVIFSITHAKGKIGYGMIDIDKDLPTNDSIHIKFALDFYRRISIKDKDALMQNAKLSQIRYGDKIYDIGKFGSFKDFIYTHIPPYKHGRIIIFVAKDREDEQPYIAVLRVPMDS